MTVPHNELMEKSQEIHADTPRNDNRLSLNALLDAIEAAHNTISNNPTGAELDNLNRMYADLSRRREELGSLTAVELGQLRKRIPSVFRASQNMPNPSAELSGLLAQVMQQEKYAGPILQPAEENAVHTGMMTAAMTGFAALGPLGALAAPAYYGVNAAIDKALPDNPKTRAATKTLLGIGAVAAAGMTGGWVPALLAVGLGSLTSWAMRSLQQHRVRESQQEFRAALNNA
ncbi:hypothetical protein HYW84_03315 [Candidatus Peregrinibacteria bacterium]|nr:hypothetical protein [Candidatus Peregrinibacteria bacterium]